MSHAMDEFRSRFGTPPRRRPLLDRLGYLRVPRPLWCLTDPFDKINVIFRHSQRVFREGVIVWGHVVQANTLLFERGRDNCPGEVVYSLADADKAEPEYLAELASDLFELKGAVPEDPALAPIAEYLAHEWTRVYGLPVPESISPFVRCQISTTMFVRKHLPDRQLCSSLLPIVVNPVKPHVALPLPGRFWPDEFTEEWVGGAY